MKVTPLNDRVLIKLAKPEEKTKSGIILVESAQEKTQEGTVVSTGDAEAIKVKSGDVVMYDKYAGTAITIEGEDHLILRANDILATIEK